MIKQKINREIIIESALEYFLKEGINTASMFGLEKYTNCTRRTIYRYFESKMDIMFEVYKIIFIKLSNTVIERRKALTTNDIREKLYQTVNIIIDTFLEFPNEVRYIIEFDAKKANSKRIQKEHAQLMNEVEFTLQILKEGVEKGVIKKEYEIWQISFLVLESLMSIVYRYLTVNDKKYFSSIESKTIYHLGEIIISDILVAK